MRRRHPLPRLWLMTDERLGERLWDALERLPGGSGIVFRHYSLGVKERQALFDEVRRRSPGAVLVSAGRFLRGADGVHNALGSGLRTASAHNLRELRRAERRGANLVFLSSVYPTRSHPRATPLGARRFAQLARQTMLPVIALGGMNEERFRSLRHAYGWAGIDAFA